MATLEKLRSKAGFLLIAFIGLALISFILTDLLSNNGGSMFQGNQLEIANIGGESVSVNEYQALVTKLEDNQKMNQNSGAIDEMMRNRLMDAAWDMLVKNHVLGKQYDELGIKVSSDELYELVQGDNPHPIIQQYFVDPETGFLNRTALLNFLKSVTLDETSPDRKAWLAIEDRIFNERLENKYKTLVKKGLFVNDIDAQAAYQEKNTKADIRFVARKYNQIPDTLVSINQKDIEKYYNEHKNEFKQNASRSLEYLIFKVKPSDADYKAAQQWINDVANEFTDIKEVAQYVQLNSDEPYDRTNYGAGELPNVLDSALFNANLGTMYGPYFEEGSYKVAKLAKIAMVPDSVKARHILLQPTEQINYQQTEVLADSLLKAIKNGADFAKIAAEYSADQSNANDAGNLGWFSEGNMVQEFNDTCFAASIGDIKKIVTQFGIHIAEILDQSKKVKKVQVGIIEHKVEPSDDTFDKYYREASEFAGKNRDYQSFLAGAKEKGMYPLQAPNLSPMDRSVALLKSPREMIKWAFEAELNQVSDVFEFGDNYVIAVLTKVNKKGFASIEEKKSELEFKVRKEKKAAMLIDEMKGLSLEEASSAFNTKIGNASGVTFASRGIDGIGYEPAVNAAALSIEKNTVSAPIKGENGVYLIEVTNVSESQPAEFAAQMEAINSARALANRANFEAYEALKEKADIEDSRSKFY